MDKKFEILKIKYENTRTWLLSLLAATLSTSIGYYAIQDVTFKRGLGIVSSILGIALVILFIIQTIRYSRLLTYLGKEKDF